MVLPTIICNKQRIKICVVSQASDVIHVPHFITTFRCRSGVMLILFRAQNVYFYINELLKRSFTSFYKFSHSFEYARKDTIAKFNWFKKLQRKSYLKTSAKRKKNSKALSNRRIFFPKSTKSSTTNANFAIVNNKQHSHIFNPFVVSWKRGNSFWFARD